jgi:hypothetical protein
MKKILVLILLFSCRGEDYFSSGRKPVRLSSKAGLSLVVNQLYHPTDLCPQSEEEKVIALLAGFFGNFIPSE